MTDNSNREGMTIEDRLARLEDLIYNYDSKSVEENALTTSVNRLGTTAEMLASVLHTVNATQDRLSGLEHTASDNRTAISKSSTKEELLKEVERLTAQRRRDRFRTRGFVAGGLVVSLALTALVALGLQEFKIARYDQNVNYQQVSQAVCEQRSITWDAMQEFIATERIQLIADKSIDVSDKAKMVVTYNKLLKSFPKVDCTKLGKGLASVPNIPSSNGPAAPEALIH